MLFIYDIDGLYLSQEVYLLQRLKTQGLPWSIWKSIFLKWISLCFLWRFDNYRDDLDVIVVVIGLSLFLEILDKSTTIDVSLEIFDIGLDVFWFVGYWEIKGVIT